MTTGYPMLICSHDWLTCCELCAGQLSRGEEFFKVALFSDWQSIETTPVSTILKFTCMQLKRGENSFSYIISTKPLMVGKRQSPTWDRFVRQTISVSSQVFPVIVMTQRIHWMEFYIHIKIVLSPLENICYFNYQLHPKLYFLYLSRRGCEINSIPSSRLC